MKRADHMCESCPFRTMNRAEMREHAIIEPDAWPCHTLHPFGWGDTQCRGHYEARRKFPLKDDEVNRFLAWQDEFTAAFAADVPADKLPRSPNRDGNGFYDN